MDPSLLSLLPTGGVATALLVVIAYLLRQNHLDRTQYRDDVAAIDARATTAAAAQEARHTAELEAVRRELADLREANVKVLAELEAERRRRWAAEDAAAEYRQQLVEKGGRS